MSRDDYTWIATIGYLQSGGCPVCGNSEHFWERRPLNLAQLGSEESPLWSATEETRGERLLECATCRLEFPFSVLDPAEEAHE